MKAKLSIFAWGLIFVDENYLKVSWYNFKLCTTSTGPALADQCRTSLSSPIYASVGTSTVCQHCARTCQYGRNTAPVVHFLLGQLYTILALLKKISFLNQWMLHFALIKNLYSSVYQICKQNWISFDEIKFLSLIF